MDVMRRIAAIWKLRAKGAAAFRSSQPVPPFNRKPVQKQLALRLRSLYSLKDRFDDLWREQRQAKRTAGGGGIGVGTL
jgi:hypothetical protein